MYNDISTIHMHVPSLSGTNMSIVSITSTASSASVEGTFLWTCKGQKKLNLAAQISIMGIEYKAEISFKTYKMIQIIQLYLHF